MSALAPLVLFQCLISETLSGSCYEGSGIGSSSACLLLVFSCFNCKCVSISQIADFHLL